MEHQDGKQPGEEGVYLTHISQCTPLREVDRNLGAEAMEQLTGLLPMCVLYMGAYGDQKTACRSQFLPYHLGLQAHH